MSRYLCALIVLIPAAAWAGEAIPGATASDWANNADDAARKAGATAAKLGGMGVGAWTAIVAGGLTALYYAKQLLPLVPYIGEPAKALIGMVANVAWAASATKDQKAADKAKDAVAIAAQRAQPILDMLRQLDPETLPPELAQILNSQEVANGLAILAAGTHSLTQEVRGK